MKSRMVLCICISLLFTGLLSADTRFTGAIDDLWSDADNWNNGLPDQDDKVQVQGDMMCVLDYDAGTIKHTALEGGATAHLRLIDGAQVAVRDWSIIGYAGAPEDPHFLEVLGGVYNADARMFIGFLGHGKLVVDHGGIVNLNAQELGIGENENGNGTVLLQGGALNLKSNSGLPLRIRAGKDSSASIDFSGGVMTQAWSEAREAYVNDHIADGTITAYDGVGTVVVASIDDDDDAETVDTLVVRGLHPLNPMPLDGGNVLPGAATLNWTLPDPCVPGQSVPVDVYFTDDLQALTSFINPDAIRIVSNQNATSASIQVQPNKRYYWAVDTYQGTDNDPVWGPIFEFTAGNEAPAVKAIDDVATWLDNGSLEVPIGGTVTDVDATTVTWTVVTEPNEGTAVIANADQIDTTVTLTALGTYELQLEADDGELKGADILTINVFENSCLAAQSLSSYVPLVGDLDQDCDVDQDDMDLLMENWLKCVALGECDPNGL